MKHRKTRHRERLLRIALMIALVILIPVSAHGATVSGQRSEGQDAPARELSTPQLIARALAAGEITADQRLLYLAYAVYEYPSLPARFRSNAGWYGTAEVRELKNAWKQASQRPGMISAPVLAELNRLLAPDAATICDQEDGPNNDGVSANFYINYDAITGALTVADYRSTLDSAFNTEVAGYGWAKPPICPAGAGACPPPQNKYPVQLASLDGGLYGYVSPSGGEYAGWTVGDNPNTPATETESTTSCMVLRDDSYISLGGLNGLRVTSAHEFAHAIQFGYGDPGWDEDTMWWEGDAAYVEDEVWDAVDDNYQYLWPDWTQCLGQWPEGAPSYPEYSTWLPFRFAAEHNGGANVVGGGEDVAQGVWANIAAGQSGLNALNNALSAKTPGASLADTFHKYAVGSRFMKSCPDSSAYCYEEAAGYVSYMGGAPENHGNIAAVGGSYSGSVRDNYAINWIGLPTTGGPYQVTLNNTSAGGQLRASVVADPTGNRTGNVQVSGFPTMVGAGESRSLCYMPPAGSSDVVAVITNQSQTAANPASCPARSYTVSLANASLTGSLSNLPTGATVDIGCGTYVKVKRNSGDPGTVTVTKHTQAPGGNPAGPGELPVYWDITATGTTYNVDLTLCYTDAELAGAGPGVVENELVLFRNATGGATWNQIGADTRDTAANCITKAGVTAFSDWTLGMPGDPTAVSVIEFSASSGVVPWWTRLAEWLQAQAQRLP